MRRHRRIPARVTSGKRTPIPANGSLFRLVRSCVVKIPTPALVLPAAALPAVALPAVARAAAPAVALPAVALPAVALPAVARAAAARAVGIHPLVAGQVSSLVLVTTTACVDRTTYSAVAVAPTKATPLPEDLSLREGDPLGPALGPLGLAPEGLVVAALVAVAAVLAAVLAVAAVLAAVLAVAAVGEVPTAGPLAAAAVSLLAAVAVAEDLQQLLVCLLSPGLRSSYPRRTT